METKITEGIVSLNSDHIEIRIPEVNGKIAGDATIGFTGEIPSMYVNRDQLFDISEMLKDYFKKRKNL